MAKDLGNKKDFRKSNRASEKGKPIIKLKPPIDFAVIVSPDYEDEFAHFIKKKKIGCKAGLDGKGFAPDDCPKCADVLDQYQEAKVLKKEGKESEAEKLRKQANDQRGKYTAYFSAIQGTVFTSRKGAKIVYEPDFVDVDEVGVLPLSEARRKMLFGLVEDPDYPEIKGGDDLIGRILKFELEEGTNKLKKVIPMGKLNTKSLKNVDLSDLPDLDAMVKLPEDYEQVLNDLETREVKDVNGDNSPVDDPDEIDLSKNKRGKGSKDSKDRKPKRTQRAQRKTRGRR